MANVVSVSGLTELEISLDKAISTMPTEVMAILGRAGFNIKKGTQRRWSGMKHLPRLPYAVSYDVTPIFTGFQLEVGADKDKKQGALANVVEFGTVNNPPRPGLAPELDLEEPKTVAALDALVAKLLDSP